MTKLGCLTNFMFIVNAEEYSESEVRVEKKPDSCDTCIRSTSSIDLLIIKQHRQSCFSEKKRTNIIF